MTPLGGQALRSVNKPHYFKHRWFPTMKIPLFLGLWIVGIFGMRVQESLSLDLLLSALLGYLQMGVLLHIHEAAHLNIFPWRWANWLYAIPAMAPFPSTFVSFRESHLLHHRFNRTAKDPDMVTTGQRKAGDFVFFYCFLLIFTVPMTAIHYLFLYPLRKLRGHLLVIHVLELILKSFLIFGLWFFATAHGETAFLLEAWLLPMAFLGLFQSVRNIGDHYGMASSGDPVDGTRSIISNPVNRFFWSNINYHIEHHLKPGVQCYNLPALHRDIKPFLDSRNAVFDSGYISVFLRALKQGPERLPQERSR